MKRPEDRKLCVAPAPAPAPARLALDDDAELARALRALALDRPSALELQRVRQRLELALSTQAKGQGRTAGQHTSAGLVVLGAALLSVLPSSAHLTRPEPPPLLAAVSLDSEHVAPRQLALTPSAAPCPSAHVATARESTPVATATRPRQQRKQRPLPVLGFEPRAAPTASKPPLAAPGPTQPASRAVDDASLQRRPRALPSATQAEQAPLSTAAADEATLLQQARRHAHTDPAAASHWLDEHERRFPHGSLSQEREVLAVQLLRAQSHAAEAEQRARAFRRDFPHSIYLTRLAVEPIP